MALVVAIWACMGNLELPDYKVIRSTTGVEGWEKEDRCHSFRETTIGEESPSREEIWGKEKKKNFLKGN